LKFSEDNSTRTIRVILENAAAKFDKCGIESSRIDAEVLLAASLAMDRTELFRRFETVLCDEEVQCFNSWVARRVRREPVAYIIGRKEFWSLEFEVGPSVLIPRPESEFLVEDVVTRASADGLTHGIMLEIGTGSGALSVAIARELPQLTIYATDVSRDALAMARHNARLNGVDARILFLGCHLCDAMNVRADFIVSNPPYIACREFPDLPVEVRDYEPRLALVAGPEGVEIHGQIIERAGEYLNGHGWLVLEMGHTQRELIERMLRKSGSFDYIEVRQDYAGIDRVVAARRRR
jgi:release factor glutamine methyltransferase